MPFMEKHDYEYYYKILLEMKPDVIIQITPNHLKAIFGNEYLTVIFNRKYKDYLGYELWDLYDKIEIGHTVFTLERLKEYIKRGGSSSSIVYIKGD